MSTGEARWIFPQSKSGDVGETGDDSECGVNLGLRLVHSEIDHFAPWLTLSLHGRATSSFSHVSTSLASMYIIFISMLGRIKSARNHGANYHIENPNVSPFATKQAFINWSLSLTGKPSLRASSLEAMVCVASQI